MSQTGEAMVVDECSPETSPVLQAPLQKQGDDILDCIFHYALTYFQLVVAVKPTKKSVWQTGLSQANDTANRATDVYG
jgi:hypothetical protein